MRLVRVATFLLVTLALAACQSTPPPPAPEGEAVTIGDWTVRTGGYVRAETGVVR
jgi:hypothetical protein